MESDYFQINTRKILFEEFEDETVVVNTDSGFYYSISSSGTVILKLLQSGCAAKDLVASLGLTDIADPFAREVEAFITRLAEEEIIISRGISPQHRPEVELPLPSRGTAPFASPVLERFDDVRELLLIDPVHQVDHEYGWPKAFREIDMAEAENREL